MRKIVIEIILLISAFSFNVTAGCDSSSGCCGEITNVYHTIQGDDITIYVTFKNTGTSTCRYRVYLYDEWDTEITYVPGWWYVSLGVDKEITEEITSASLFSSWKLYDLGEEYTVELMCNGCSNQLDSITKNIYPEECEDYIGIGCVEIGTEIGDDAGNKIECKKGGSCIINCEVMEGKCYCNLVHSCADKCIWSEERDEAFCEFYKEFRCEGDDYACADGSSPTVSCSTYDECRIRCAEACGRLTTCGDRCEDCCLGEICSRDGYTANERHACLNSCFGVCNTRKTVCDIEGLLRGIAIWVAIVLFAFHAFKFLVYSGDPEARKKAKLGIFYVIAGLLLFMIAIPLVNYIYGGEEFRCYHFSLLGRCRAYEFLHIKIDPWGQGHGDYDIWEFHGTDDKCHDIMHLGTMYRAIGSPPTIYDCGILLQDEDDSSYDDGYMLWVVSGGMIRKNGNSIINDLTGTALECCCDEESGLSCGTNKCCLEDESACALENTSHHNYCNPNVVTSVGGKSYEDTPATGQNCGDCALAQGIPGEKIYRPAYDILCANDGKWHVCDEDGCRVKADGTEYECRDGIWTPI